MRGLSRDVHRVVWWEVDIAVDRAVYREENEAIYWEVNESEAVYWAVYEAMKTDSGHPALQEFLRRETT